MVLLKFSQIDNLEKLKEESLKKILHFKGENRSLQESLTRLQEKIQIQERVSNQVTENQENVIHSLEERIQELETQIQYERMNFFNGDRTRRGKVK